MATTARHGFWVASSSLITPHNKPLKLNFSMSNLKSTLSAPINMNRVLVTRRPVYPVWT